jgi:hypothetical protein
MNVKLPAINIERWHHTGRYRKICRGHGSPGAAGKTWLRANINVKAITELGTDWKLKDKGRHVFDSSHIMAV